MNAQDMIEKVAKEQAEVNEAYRSGWRDRHTQRDLETSITVSPIYRMIERKMEFGIEQRKQATIEKQEYYVGYYDACGELLEALRDLFDRITTKVEIKSKFTQEFMLEE